MTTEVVLYIILAAFAIYLLCVYFEGFGNNSSVRDDPAGDRPFTKLSLQDRVDYLAEKQDAILRSLRQR